MIIATISVYVFYSSLFLGLLFAMWFIANGVRKIDDGMHSAPWKMRLMLLPGSVLLWPYLLKRILKHT
ncbi:MAG: hypothetical protein R2825_23195 [Saprospiraceae bacterium]